MSLTAGQALVLVGLGIAIGWGLTKQNVYFECTGDCDHLSSMMGGELPEYCPHCGSELDHHRDNTLHRFFVRIEELTDQGEDR